MTVKCTSKAALLSVKESGAKQKQEQKVLDIILTGGVWTLQHLISAYEKRHGVRIDSGVMSARMNELKTMDNPQVRETLPQKCSISGRTVTPLTSIDYPDVCTHNRYRGHGFMQLKAATNDTNICHIGMVIKKCADCDADISKYKLVPVMTATEYLRSLG